MSVGPQMHACTHIIAVHMHAHKSVALSRVQVFANLCVPRCACTYIKMLHFCARVRASLFVPRYACRRINMLHSRVPQVRVSLCVLRCACTRIKVLHSRAPGCACKSARAQACVHACMLIKGVPSRAQVCMHTHQRVAFSHARVRANLRVPGCALYTRVQKPLAANMHMPKRARTGQILASNLPQKFLQQKCHSVPSPRDALGEVGGPGSSGRAGGSSSGAGHAGTCSSFRVDPHRPGWSPGLHFPGCPAAYIKAAGAAGRCSNHVDELLKRPWS